MMVTGLVKITPDSAFEIISSFSYLKEAFQRERISRMGIVFGMTGTQEPAFKLLQLRAGHPSNYEIRQYQPFLVAEVNSKKGDDSSFRILAKYIGVFGTPANEGKLPMAMTAPVLLSPPALAQKIAMTSPVITTGSDELMGFVMPFEFQRLSDLPKPLDSRIMLRQIPSRIVATKIFSGWYSPSEGKRHFKALQSDLIADGLIDTPKSQEEEDASWECAQYHPPFTLPFLRRNEIWVEIKKNFAFTEKN